MSGDTRGAEGMAQPAPPLRILGSEAVVCEGDSCLIVPAEPAQS